MNPNILDAMPEGMKPVRIQSNHTITKTSGGYKYEVTKYTVGTNSVFYLDNILISPLLDACPEPGFRVPQGTVRFEDEYLKNRDDTKANLYIGNQPVNYPLHTIYNPQAALYTTVFLRWYDYATDGFYYYISVILTGYVWSAFDKTRGGEDLNLDYDYIYYIG